MSTEELLQHEETAWARLADALDAVPPERREIEGVVPGWSAHDVAWHCVYWAGDAGEMLERILGGEPDPPDSDEPDEEVLAAGRATAWDDILRRAEQGRERVRGGVLCVRRSSAESGGAVRERDLRSLRGARGAGPRVQRLVGAADLSRGRLEQLDRVAGRVVEHGLLATGARHDLAAERDAGVVQARDLGLDVVDLDDEAVPAARLGCGAVGHGPRGRAAGAR